jgi:aspartate aminotransferase
MDYRLNEIKTKLEEAHHCLNGYNRDGTQKTHKGVYDEDGIISFIEGGSQRRAHYSVLKSMTAALVNPDAFPIEAYTNYDIYPDLYNKAKQQFCGWGIPESLAGTLAFANGSIQLFTSFLKSACKEGDILLTGKSFYHAFSPPPYNTRVSLVSVDTQHDNDYKLTATDILNWIDQNPDLTPRGILISNPTPIGALYTEAELKDLAECIIRHNLIVYLDAVYKGTEYNGQKHPSLAALPDMDKHVVTVTSPSKTLGCANLRIGWACGPKSIIDKMIKVTVDSVTTICQLNQIGAAEALSTPRSYCIKNAKEAQKRALLIADLTEKLNAKLRRTYHTPDHLPFIKTEVIPKCGYSIMLNFPGLKGLRYAENETIKDDLDLTAYLLNYGVGVSPCYSTGFRESCCVRLAFAEIGQPHARTATNSLEIQENLKTLLDIAAPGQPELWPQVAKLLNLDENEAQTEHAVDQAFAATRQVIIAAFEDRIFRALNDLLGFNALDKAVKCSA